jgi:glycosyltransferase involved in cell wall biosynthesis
MMDPISIAAAIVGFLLTAGSAAWAWIAVRSRATYSLLENLGRRCVQPSGLVSVIIPGRNVERWVRGCLGSVLSQKNVLTEVIFVDDSSSDGTGRIVQSEFVGHGVRYLRLEEVPEGWRGKTWAVSKGYESSRGDLLLFLDADTRLQDDFVVADSVATLLERGLDALSLMPRLDRSGISSRIMLPLLWNIFLALFPPTRGNDPRDPFAVLFGAFILVRREAYERVGGHYAVRDRLLEDRALAQLLKGRGLRIMVLRASQRVTAEYAGSLAGYFNAIQRIAADYAATRDAGRLPIYTAGSILFLLLPQSTLLLSLILASTPLLLLSLVNIGANLAANLLEMLRDDARRDLVYLPLTLLANWVLAAALLKSCLALRRGGVTLTWRGRRLTIGLPQV